MSEVARPRATVAQWVIVIIIGFIVYLTAYLTRNLSVGRAWQVNGWWIPFIYIILIIELLRRMNPRWKPSPTLLTMLLLPMFVFGGKTFLATFTGETNFTNTIAPFWHSFTLVAVYFPDTREVFTKFIPSWFVPRDVSQVETLWVGGGPVNWSVWIGPLVAWSIVLISTWLLHTFIAYLITGPQWVEVEKLVFPPSIPATYLIRTYVTPAEGEEKSMLFNLADPTVKAFWIAMIAGLIVGLPTYITLWMPELRYVLGAAGGGLLMFWVDIRPLMQAMLPGAQGVAHWYLGSTLWSVLLPWDTLITVIITWLIFGIIYPVAAVKAGLIPYSPGMEGWNQWSIGANPANPFPYTIFIYGFPLGLGIWYLWSARDRIITGLKALTGPDKVEHDMSYRFRMLGLIIAALMWIIIWSAVGMPFIVAIAFLIIWVIYSISAGRVWAEFGPWGLECSPSIWQYVWPIGAIMGAWPWGPAQNTSIVAFSIAGSAYSTCLGFNNCPTSIGGQTWAYRVAHDSGANLRDMMLWSIIMAIIFVPIYIAFDIWVCSHIGFSNLGEGRDMVIGWNHARIALGMGVNALNYWLGDVGRVWTWFGAGAITAIILSILRAKFAWFFINPIMMIAAVSEMHWLWLNIIIAAVIKYVLTKTLGPARTVRYMIPIVAGFLIGAGLPYIISGIFVIVTAALPNVAANWK